MHWIRFLKKSEKIWLCCVTRKALIAVIQQFIFNNVWILKSLRRLFDHSTFSKDLKHFLKVIDCTQQLQVRENVVRFEKALGAVKVIKDQIQNRSQSLLHLARGYFNILKAGSPVTCYWLGQRRSKDGENNLAYLCLLLIIQFLSRLCNNFS